jgi:FkbH-like protein
MTDSAATRLDVPPGQVLDSLLEEAAAAEVPAGDLCLRIARVHAKLGAPDHAISWLARVPEAADGFLVWSAASTALAAIATEARPTARRQVRVGIAGSYTTSQLAAMLPLAALARGIDLRVHEGLYGQYQQDLIDPASELYRSDPEQIVVAVHEGAAQLPRESAAPADDVAMEANRWKGLWDMARRHSGAAIVQHGFALRPEAPLGHLTAGIDGSRHAMMQAVNRELALAAGDDVSIVDCDRLAAEVGRDRWFDDRYWFRSKQAVALEALPLLARHTSAVIAARAGLSKKCLVLDLDNTLWGGVVGEDGLAGIRLGSDAVGEAFVAFQEYVLELKARGVILAVASKNNEADARAVFEQHPDMRIKLDDVAVFAVNWDDKPANLRRIAGTLGIGLDSLVLADDNPAERQIVRRLVPEVDVLTLPGDPAEYRRALAGYLGFETVAITDEDRRRTSQYRARAAAAELASSAVDIDSFYRDLRMKAVVAPFDEENLPRIAQLFGKTNQFNLTTRRHGIAELRRFMADGEYMTRYLKLSDRFVDHGLVALVVVRLADGLLDIESLLMSCRVIGRTVEAELLAHASREAIASGCRALRGTYIPTAKNAVVRDLYRRFGFQLVATTDDGVTHWEYDLERQGPIESGFIQAAAAR